MEQESKLQTGWILEKQGNLCKLGNGEKCNKSNLPYFEVKYLRGKKEKTLVSEGKFVKAGTKVIIVDGENSGEVFEIPEDGYMGSTCKTLEFSPDINEKYLLYFIGLNRQFYKKNKKGSATPHLDKKLFSEMKLNFPISSEEQAKIVTKIEELFSEIDDGIKNLIVINQQLAMYKYSVIQQAFKGKYTEHLAIDNVNLNWVDNSTILQLEKIPEEWKYIKLSELGDLGRGKSKHRPRNDARLFENGKYPFIQTGEVKAAKKYIETWSKMYGEFGLSQSKLWNKGTLCITIAANIAETAFLGVDACFPDSIVGFTPSNNINIEYVRYFIESQKLRLWAFAPATAQKNINLDTLENLVIPYCNIQEQDEIVRQIDYRLTVYEQIKKSVDETLKQADMLKISILKKAFRGEL